jgi:hypothetical protein
LYAKDFRHKTKASRLKTKVFLLLYNGLAVQFMFNTFNYAANIRNNFESLNKKEEKSNEIIHRLFYDEYRNHSKVLSNQ